MARGNRNAPSTASSSTDKKARKSPQEAKAAIVATVRKVIRRGVARLQAAEMRASGNPEGNFELLKAYKSFDAQLEAIATGEVVEA